MIRASESNKAGQRGEGRDVHQSATGRQHTHLQLVPWGHLVKGTKTRTGQEGPFGDGQAPWPRELLLLLG